MRPRAPWFLLFLVFSCLALPVAPARAGEPSASPAGVDSLFAAPSLDLNALETAVLGRNPSLASMRAAWEATEARAVVAGAWDDPRVEGMVAPRSLGASDVDPGWSVEVSQMVPLFGQRAAMGKASRAMARSMR